jgi:hypothetical protein
MHYYIYKTKNTKTPHFSGGGGGGFNCSRVFVFRWWSWKLPQEKTNNVLIFTHMTSWSAHTTLALSSKDSMDLVRNAFTMTDIRDVSLKSSLFNHPMELPNKMCL